MPCHGGEQGLRAVSLWSPSSPTEQLQVGQMEHTEGHMGSGSERLPESYHVTEKAPKHFKS